mmetsp:Transcript_48832/g.157820  ORF Transcript_48832/g.157820 Transcript_48832/m.157820 type:complete len:243 (+) Transcript_48832:201-929(+)
MANSTSRRGSSPPASRTLGTRLAASSSRTFQTRRRISSCSARSLMSGPRSPRLQRTRRRWRLYARRTTCEASSRWTAWRQQRVRPRPYRPSTWSSRRACAPPRVAPSPLPSSSSTARRVAALPRRRPRASSASSAPRRSLTQPQRISARTPPRRLASAPRTVSAAPSRSCTPSGCRPAPPHSERAPRSSCRRSAASAAAATRASARALPPTCSQPAARRCSSVTRTRCGRWRRRLRRRRCSR